VVLCLVAVFAGIVWAAIWGFKKRREPDQLDIAPLLESEDLY
jgi:hypothetical protein